MQCPNLIQNGSFEQGPVFGTAYYSVAVGSDEILAWSVTRRAIDIKGTDWRPSDGNRSIDLDDTPGAGGIAQTFATTPGKRYVVIFDLASNPYGEPAVKTMQVDAAGQSNIYTFDSTGRDGKNMGWIEQRWEFTASASQTTLEFSSLNTSPEDAYYWLIIE